MPLAPQLSVKAVTDTKLLIELQAYERYYTLKARCQVSDVGEESNNGKIKGAMSRYFESFSVTCKITFNVKETTKY